MGNVACTHDKESSLYSSHAIYCGVGLGHINFKNRMNPPKPLVSCLCLCCVMLFVLPQSFRAFTFALMHTSVNTGFLIHSS